jgi:hypothetical protein
MLRIIIALCVGVAVGLRPASFPAIGRPSKLHLSEVGIDHDSFLSGMSMLQSASPDVGAILNKAASKALNGGSAGASAAAVQVVSSKSFKMYNVCM